MTESYLQLFQMVQGLPGRNSGRNNNAKETGNTRDHTKVYWYVVWQLIVGTDRIFYIGWYPPGKSSQHECGKSEAECYPNEGSTFGKGQRKRVIQLDRKSRAYFWNAG